MVASASKLAPLRHRPPLKAPTFFLPDFCASPAIFVVVLIAELVALVIALARQALHDNFWTDLAGGSMFLLWIGLTCSAVLCRVPPLVANDAARARGHGGHRHVGRHDRPGLRSGVSGGPRLGQRCRLAARPASSRTLTPASC